MMKKLMVALTAALVAVRAWAETEIVDGIEWSYTVSDGKVELQNLAIPKDTIGAIAIPPTLGGYPVTSVGSHAFFGCSGLTSVTIPDGVTDIGWNAFKDCTSLTSVTIPNGVTNIGVQAFWGCSSLTSMTIPDSVTRIEDWAFRDCIGLTSVTIGNSVTSIGSWAFLYCSGLTSVTIGNSVTSIGDFAFEGCSSLTSVIIPDSVTSIGNWAFEDCIGLTSVTIPDNVTNIGYGAFMWCSNLTTSVTSFETIDGVKWSYYPMWDDEADEPVAVVIGANPLQSVLNIPSAVGGDYPIRKIGDYAFCDNDIVTEIVFPDSVTSIEEGAFADCIGLSSVTIPGSVKEIEESAFEDCIGLKSVNFSEGLEVIGEDAFCGCENLGDVTIPSTVKEMDSGSCFAFAYKVNSVFVAEGNPYFKSIDGVVYSKDGSRIVCFPAGRTGEWAVPDHVTEIVEFAFAGGSLSALSIGAEVKTIGDGIVVDSFNLARIAVNAENPYFKDVDGVLFSTDGTRLLAYPAGKKDVSVYTVPATVTSIDQDAFGGSLLTGIILPSTLKCLWYETFVDSERLESIIVGADLEIIGDNAFYCIPQLHTLTLPASLKTIEDWAFEECGNSETTIYVPEAAVADEDAYEDCPATIVKYSSAPLVKFNLNYDGAPNYPYDRNVVSGQPVGILMTPERDRHSFAGWYTVADGGTQITAATVVAGDVTYYAQWTKNNDSAPVAPGYDAIDEKDIVAPYDAPKAVVLQGAAYDGDGAVVGIVELKLGKVSKGSGKLSGSFVGLDGKKRAIKAPKLTGIDGASPVIVALDVKGLGTMNVTIGGGQFAGSMGKYHVQSANVGGNWSKSGAKVYVEAASATLPAGTLEDLLPAGEPVVAAGGKWKFDKAASVKWAKPKKGAAQPEIYDEVSGKGLVVDTTKGKNLSGLKLTYTPKKGTFKGSFNAYALEGTGSATKLKKYKLNVSGVVVNGTGYGTAVCKNPALNWAVTVR